MCLRAYTRVWGDSHSIENQKVGRPTGEGGCKLSDNPGQTGEGGSENLDFCRTSFMNNSRWGKTDIDLQFCQSPI